jgi:glycolate oxidase iron-sulfur subunit
LRASGTDVVLFTGCVMDAWQRDVHLAAQRVIEATGAGVAFPGLGAACCGALHEHAGLARGAHRLAERVMAATPGNNPILVDSAGCGAALKDYGRVLGTPVARAFSERVQDVHEWLAARVDRLPPAARPVAATVAVQDPCHLRHVQRRHDAVRVVLRPFVTTLVELDDDGLCCGAGGAFSVTHPELAAPIRERKLAAIARSGAALVASANPGCSMHLAGAGVATVHPVELIDAALRGVTP